MILGNAQALHNAIFAIIIFPTKSTGDMRVKSPIHNYNELRQKTWMILEYSVKISNMSSSPQTAQTCFAS